MTLDSLPSFCSIDARQSEDQELCHRIELFLRSLPLPCLRRVHVAVKGGVVRIAGTTRSFYERQLAIACVKRVAGVRQVADLIVVLDGARPGRELAKRPECHV